jgi:predicted dienelactone hydrolase
MRKRNIALITLGVLTAAAGVTAYTLMPTVHSGQPGEAPELGIIGEYPIGTVTTRFTLPPRKQITLTNALTGNLEAADRTLSVRFWYPAEVVKEGKPTRYSHVMQLAGKDPVTITSQGMAISDAKAIAGKKFPLVLMSHGYGAWSTHYSNLGEHLASRGYVVASIDHADEPATGVPSLLVSFGNVLKDRSLDQRQVLTQIIDKAQKEAAGYAAQIDPEKVAVIGYSMGAYGALATVGADYDYAGNTFTRMQGQAIETMKAGAAETSPVKALVAIAPWGGAPENRAWTAGSLAKITQPTLVISGNQDDIVNFKDGVQWIFDSMKGSDRHMLVYREARHNIAGNEFAMADNSDFTTLEFLREPVWRTDRINSINQHFVTAFLDYYLKGDASKIAYLNAPKVNSNDSQWPVAFGEQLNGKRAGADEKEHWRGFPRRWAVGLELHKKPKGQ